MGKITALVVENLPTSQCNLREALQKEPDILLVGAAAGVTEALELARQLKPDVILLNIGLGVQAVRELHQENGMAAVMMLTAHANSAEAREAFMAGGAAYCRQGISACMLKQALRQVAQGHYVLGDQVFDKEGVLAKLATYPKTGRTLPARQTVAQRYVIL